MKSVGPASGVTAGGILASERYEALSVVTLVAFACAVWYFFIVLVQIIGTTQLFRYYSSKPSPAACLELPKNDIPHITILRPVKGLEPQLYECLAATFHQSYPRNKLTIYFCIASKDDPAYPVLRQLVSDFPGFDVKVFVEEEDPNLSGNGESSNLGPNPKIRNMSRGYREAIGDVIWIIDCNVWIGKGVAGRMVSKLQGYKENGSRVTPYKFVHQLPLVVDVVGKSAAEEARGLLSREYHGGHVSSTSTTALDVSQPPPHETTTSHILRTGGGRLEEMFMASSHAKFYTAINTVSIAPCIVGKSTMFRRSHLDHLTSSSPSYSPGIDFFSENICEDHLIGDILWRKSVPGEDSGEKWRKHGLVFGDLAIQPMAEMSVKEYIARRVRWLRVRKWTVIVATLVEPGVESFLCSAYGAFAATTLPWFNTTLHIPQTWLAFALLWLASVTVWVILDWFVYARLQSCACVEVDADTPFFARPRGGPRRPFSEWLSAWLCREAFALPVWTVAVLGGATVVWRSKTFRVGMDMKVRELKGPNVVQLSPKSVGPPEVDTGRSSSKDRQD